jgi:hypothetical protein
MQSLKSTEVVYSFFLCQRLVSDQFLITKSIQAQTYDRFVLMYKIKKKILECIW